MEEPIVLTIGWIGFIFCSSAYMLLNIRIIRFDGIVYQLLNIVGGICLVVSASFFSDIPNTAANILWVFIALFGIIRYSKSFRSSKKY
ncbi:CBU_0592 family membrane protein [Sphingobacterium sp. SYP-B4668]|uniref:CBU_0592 family membrane protein n=1 Tax=Sphingobacterium sp. SYP-B4668 TaxID=2996035 RepID=UPI003FA766EF